MDLVIVNTCAVTENAIAKDKRMIGKGKLENPNSKVIFMGCWPNAYEEQVQKMKVDLIWECRQIWKFVDLYTRIVRLLFFRKTKTG